MAKSLIHLALPSNPQHMHKGYGSNLCVCVCVCVCVYFWASCYIHVYVPYLYMYIESQMFCADFNCGFRGLLATFTVHLCLLRLIVDQLSVDKRDSDCFFSRKLVCSTSDSSYNLTDSYHWSQ